MNFQDCVILVSSCDRYSDLWEPYFSLLHKFWPDCPFKIALISEEKKHESPKIHSLTLGSSADWSTLVLRALDRINVPYVLFTLEDFFLREKVDSKKIIRLYELFSSNNLNLLRLCPRPGPDIKTEWLDYGILSPQKPYRVSTQAAFWRTDVLRHLIKEGESAWEFEINGSNRSRDLVGFASVWEDALPYRHHVIERGKWFPWDYARFSRMNIGVIPSSRPVMSIGETLFWLFKKSVRYFY